MKVFIAYIGTVIGFVLFFPLLVLGCLARLAHTSWTAGWKTPEDWYVRMQIYVLQRKQATDGGRDASADQS